MYNLPNFITLARLFSVPLIVWLVATGHLNAAFWLFVASGVSDAVDGFLARRWNLVSRLGSILDPIADKALLVSSFIVLGISGYVPLWLVILVVSRDILIIGAFSLSGLLGQDTEVHPIFISKINTTTQICLVMAILGDRTFDFVWTSAVQPLTYLVAVTTLLSGAAYLRRWFGQQTDVQRGK